MFIILFLLMLIAFFPFLLLPFGLIFVFLILFLPFKFTFDSIFNLITVPSQIYQIAINPVLRKNHGLEHATVNILEKDYGYTRLAGYAKEDGFYIIGVNNLWQVEEAARKGLQLMQSGYHDLAIHKNCGTSMTVANFISAILFLILLFYTGHFSIINMLIAILIANLLGPFFGQLVQKYFTTTSEVEDMEIVRANYSGNNQWNYTPKVFIHTTQIPFLHSN